MFDILPTDKSFKTSPQEGKDCLCSRCLKPILKGPVIRAWPDNIGEDEKSNIEWRFHPECIGMTAFNSDDEDDDFFDPDPDYPV